MGLFGGGSIRREAAGEWGEGGREGLSRVRGPSNERKMPNNAAVGKRTGGGR